MGFDLDDIIKMSCWSKQLTFRRLCAKDLEYMGKNDVFAETIVKSFQN